MSAILYYSNFCNHSKSIIAHLSKYNLTSKDVHFLCIDKRVKEGGKTFIVLHDGKKIIMPETINRVPALLLINNGYEILYGDSITDYFKPKQEEQIKRATSNNLEPSSYSLGNSGFGIVSDNYSFLDMDTDELSAKGNGGIRQMHNYVDLQFNDKISTPDDDETYKGSNKISGDITVEKLQMQRETEFQKIQPQKKI